MHHEVITPVPLIECGIAARMLPGEAASGDRHVVKFFPNGALVAAVDGLGHGDEAAAAAEIAVATLETFAPSSPIALVTRCHEAMRKTRGAAMSIASFNALDNTMTWLGVGNVDAALLRADADARPSRESILLRGGVVGLQLPTLRESVLPVKRGDTLIIATDGIEGGFTEGLTPGDPPQQIADLILARHGKDTDDALVLVARYLGGAPCAIYSR